MFKEELIICKDEIASNPNHLLPCWVQTLYLVKLHGMVLPEQSAVSYQINVAFLFQFYELI